MWPGGIEHEHVLLLLIDAAAYMLKAGAAIQTFYPRALHVTCVADGLHRVADFVRIKFPVVDKLIANGKHIYLKAPHRVHAFKTAAPDLPLPPQPCITRWGTWLKAAFYYARNFDQVSAIIRDLDENDASSIASAQQALSNPEIRPQLAYILAHFQTLTNAIESLQEQGLPLSTSLHILDGVRDSLHEEGGLVLQEEEKKFDDVQNRNPNLHIIRLINDILCGQDGHLPEEFVMPPDALAAFKFAPITTCSLERAFSRYANLLSDRRRALTFDNLTQHFMLLCNTQPR